MIHLFSALLPMFLAVSPGILIPAPVQAESGTGTYTLPELPTYLIAGKTDADALTLCLENAGIGFRPASGKECDVRITLEDRKFHKMIASKSLPEHAKEAAYSLSITPKGIDIKAITVTGAFYALQSLGQMAAAGRKIEECLIVDWPRFKWRGLMIDISRNFRGKDFIIKQIDAMARVKLNKLHLHLTDDAGWRIQIDSRPELTRKAAWRIGGTWKQWRDFGGMYSEEGSPLASGGYLTKDEIREIVSYAAERQIDVVPEFEIPGHSREVLAAYPELACLDREGNPVLNTSDVCPGNPHIFSFIDDVLTEIAELFPSEYIHIGGDEASRSAWRDCPHCQKVMEENGISGTAGLQSWMTAMVEKMVEAHGRKMIGWDEIMEGGLSDNATVMSWRGEENGLKAIAEGHCVVMSPNRYLYLDYTQDAPVKEPEAIGGYIPLELAYSYNADYDSPCFLGVQGNMWTEMIASDAHAEYMLYPRAFAVAETGWSPAARKDYQDFRCRASWLCSVMRAEGYNTFDIDNEFGDRPESCEKAEHAALGKPVRVLTPYAENYSAAGDASLTDGIRGSWSYSDRRWLGFLRDIDIIIDLEAERPVHYVGAAFMAQRNNHVGLPERVEVYLSDDGEGFSLAGVTYSQLPADTREMAYVDLGCVVNGTARYVRFKAFRRNMALHDWLFTDEIIVN